MSEELFGNDYPDFKEFGDPSCATSYPDAFFAEDLSDLGMLRGRYVYEQEAKQICRECPYMKRCLNYALKHPELLGIWGATTENQRKKIRRGIKVNLNVTKNRND